MPTNSTNFNIPKPVASEVFNLTNFNAILDAIDTNVKSKLDEKVASTDYVKTPGYGATSGSANSYSVTLTPAPTSYVDGMTVAVKINIDSTGASTLNVNALGSRALKGTTGADVTNLKANGIYTFRYNATTSAFILQGEGSDPSALITATNNILGS